MNYKEGCNILYNESFKRFANIIEHDISQLKLDIIDTEQGYKDIKGEIVKVMSNDKIKNKYFTYLQSEKILKSMIILDPKFMKSFQTKTNKMNFDVVEKIYVPTSPILGKEIVNHETKSFQFENKLYDKVLKEKSVKYYDYCKLIGSVDVYKSEVQAKNNLFNWFKLRSAILVNNSKILTPYIRYKLWMSAYGNILKVINDKNIEGSDYLIIVIWKNILSSFYCFIIFMFGIKPSKLFKGALGAFLPNIINVQLLETILFPISFLFTPFLYINQIVKVEFNEKTTLKAKQKKLEEMIDCAQIYSLESNCLVKWIELEDNSLSTFMLTYDAIRTHPKRVKKEKVKDESEKNEEN